MIALLWSLAVAAAGTCPDHPTPGADWSERSGADPAAVAALDGYAFPPRVEETREGVRTDGLVVIQGGAIVHERYAEGWGPTQPHLIWSATKTFTNALIGIAVRDGLLDVEDSICKHIDSPNPEHCDATIADFLEMSSGIAWRETYEGQPPTASSVLAMLWGEGRTSTASFVLSHGRRDAPGNTWEYSSGDTNVLAAIAGKVLAPTHGEHFPWPLLFEPLGIEHAVWERDLAGTYIGSSYLYMPPRDMARFGLLWLHDGCWGGERLLPEGWVAASTEVTAGTRKAPIGLGDGGLVQGRQVWLNQPVPEQGRDKGLPDVPASMFAATGHWGQYIFVFPEHDTVVAYTGDNRDGSFDMNELLKLALEVADSATEPAPDPTPDGDAPVEPADHAGEAE